MIDGRPENSYSAVAYLGFSGFIRSDQVVFPDSCPRLLLDFSHRRPGIVIGAPRTIVYRSIIDDGSVINNGNIS